MNANQKMLAGNDELNIFFVQIYRGIGSEFLQIRTAFNASYPDADPKTTYFEYSSF